MSAESLKHTPLYELHAEREAKFGGFAGYSMPLFYPLGMLQEHLHTRSKAGLFDISHMVQIEISGAQASQLVGRLCPYRPAQQASGTCRYTFFLNNEAGIIDDLIITRLAEERFLIVANGACEEKDIEHIHQNAAAFDATVQVQNRAFLALQGPLASSVLAAQGFDLNALAFMQATENTEGQVISRTGYTGEDGFEIALPAADATAFARQLLDNDNVELIGLGARDTLRLEAGLSLYGQDLNETILPQEAGLLWAIPADCRSGGDYIGAEALQRSLAAERQRKRVGLLAEGKIPVRAGAPLIDEAGNHIGVVTSGGFGPTVNAPVALGLIAAGSDKSQCGKQQIHAQVRKKQVRVQLAKLPFVAHRYKR